VGIVRHLDRRVWPHVLSFVWSGLVRGGHRAKLLLGRGPLVGIV